LKDEKPANTEDYHGRFPSKKEYLWEEVNDHEPSYFHPLFFSDQTWHYSNHCRILVFCSTTLKISRHLGCGDGDQMQWNSFF
jgi:hypothetical protein